MREETTRGDILVIVIRGDRDGCGQICHCLSVGQLDGWKCLVSSEKSQRQRPCCVDLAGIQISWSANNAWRYWVLQQAALSGIRISDQHIGIARFSKDRRNSAFQGSETRCREARQGEAQEGIEGEATKYTSMSTTVWHWIGDKRAIGRPRASHRCCERPPR